MLANVLMISREMTTSSFLPIETKLRSNMVNMRTRLAENQCKYDSISLVPLKFSTSPTCLKCKFLRRFFFFVGLPKKIKCVFLLFAVLLITEQMEYESAPDISPFSFSAMSFILQLAANLKRFV
uniref:Uncharacterized protein n=1 Tax=Glossina austeni TaxID=7395 RepID=A0A1A9VHQ7_GLOAU